MENRTRNFLLFLGTGLAVSGILLYYLRAISGLFPVILIITGLVIVVIGIYNWGAGTDFSSKQETPMENVSIEYNNDMKPVWDRFINSH